MTRVPIPDLLPSTRIICSNLSTAIARVDESGFLEQNWNIGTKLGQFWDSDLGPLIRVPATFVG